MGSSQAWVDLLAFGYAAYVAYFAGAAVMLVYCILLAVGASIGEWIVEHVFNQERSSDLPPKNTTRKSL